MGPRGSFGMVLDRKCLFAFQPETCQSSVVQVDMGHYGIRIILKFILVDNKAVVLGCYFAFARFNIFNRVI